MADIVGGRRCLFSQETVTKRSRLMPNSHQHIANGYFVCTKLHEGADLLLGCNLGRALSSGPKRRRHSIRDTNLVVDQRCGEAQTIFGMQRVFSKQGAQLVQAACLRE